MKIAGTDPGTSIQALQAAQQARATDQQPPPSDAGLTQRAGLDDPSSVQLSARAEEVQHARELAKAEPEVRAEVVEQAKADYAAGQLKADPAELAALIARDLF